MAPRPNNSGKHTAPHGPPNELPQDTRRSELYRMPVSARGVHWRNYMPYDLTFASFRHVTFVIDPKSATPLCEQLHGKLEDEEMQNLLRELDTRTASEENVNRSRLAAGLKELKVSEAMRLSRASGWRKVMDHQRHLYAIALRNSDCCDVDIIYHQDEYEPAQMRVDMADIWKRNARVYHIYPWNAAKGEMRFSTIISSTLLNELFPNPKCMRLRIEICHNTMAAPPDRLNVSPASTSSTITQRDAPQSRAFSGQERPSKPESISINYALVPACMLQDLDDWWKEGFHKRNEQLQLFTQWDHHARHGGDNSHSEVHLALAERLSIRPVRPYPKLVSLSDLYTTTVEDRERRKVKAILEMDDYQHTMSRAWRRIGTTINLAYQIRVFARVLEEGPADRYYWARDHLHSAINQRYSVLTALGEAIDQIATCPRASDAPPKTLARVAARDAYAELTTAYAVDGVEDTPFTLSPPDDSQADEAAETGGQSGPRVEEAGELSVSANAVLEAAVSPSNQGRAQTRTQPININYGPNGDRNHRQVIEREEPSRDGSKAADAVIMRIRLPTRASFTTIMESRRVYGFPVFEDVPSGPIISAECDEFLTKREVPPLGIISSELSSIAKEQHQSDIYATDTEDEAERVVQGE